MLLKGACSSGKQAFICPLETGPGAPGSAHVLALSSHYIILKWFELPTHPPQLARGTKNYSLGMTQKTK